jgi:hypothetical protein
LPGVFKYGNPQNRIHLTEKPLQLMCDIVKITVPGGNILDPFVGSGTTVLAAVLEGYSAIGIEITMSTRAGSRADQETPCGNCPFMMERHGQLWYKYYIGKAGGAVQSED